MVMISKSARLSYTLNGAPCSAPEDIESTEIIADFSDENVQANITAKNWSFYNQDAQTILDWIAAGKKYEGMPFKITAYNDSNTLVAADLLLDLTTENYLNKWEDERRIVVDIVKDNGLNVFFELLKANSLAFLEEEGVFTQNDYQNCKYVVEKNINIVEELTTALVLFLMVQELINQIRTVATTINNWIAHGVGGATGGIAAAIFAIAQLIIDVAYASAILIVILELGKDLFDTFNPPIRTHKTLNLKLAMEKVCGYFGYTLNTSISLLDDLYYQPSNPQLEAPKLLDFLTTDPGTTSGIPRVGSAQYSAEGFFEEVKKEFNGKFAIVGNVLEFHPKGDAFWFKQANYNIPGTRPHPFGDNAGDLKASTLLTFAYDLNDEYTIDDQTGRLYEIQTRQTGGVDQKRNMIKGYEEVNFNVCLGTRKDGLSELEKALQVVGGVIDSLVNFFGGNSNLAGSIENKIGVLKQTSNWNSLPKILMLQGDKIHPNHKTLYSTEALYNQFYAYNSFVLNNYGGQREIHKGIVIPFGMVDFLQVIDNSYATDPSGRNAHIDSFKWKMIQDTATADYWVKETFTTNLQETYIIPK